MMPFSGEPALKADFADRVLMLADRRLAQRRRVGWVAGGAIICAGVAAILVWSGLATAPQPVAPTQILPFATASAALREPRVDSANPLSYFFPDAEPLARFAAEEEGGDADEGASSLFVGQD